MFERLQSFFQSLALNQPEGEFSAEDPRIAVAALCIQVMGADGVVRDAEKLKLRELLKDKYQLDEPRLDALLAAGEKAESEAVDYSRFTSDLKRSLDTEQRQQLMGILWDIVYSDGNRSEIEDHVLWRIADLLGVSGRESVNQRLDAAARLEMTSKIDAT